MNKKHVKTPLTHRRAIARHEARARGMSGRPRAVDVRGFVGIRLPRGPVESEDIPRQGQASFRRRRPSSGGSWRRSQRRAKSRSTAAPGAKHRLPAGARSPRRGPRQAHGPPARAPSHHGRRHKKTNIRKGPVREAPQGAEARHAHRRAGPGVESALQQTSEDARADRAPQTGLRQEGHGPHVRSPRFEVSSLCCWDSCP